jgi:hypothetical protein
VLRRAIVADRGPKFPVNSNTAENRTFGGLLDAVGRDRAVSAQVIAQGKPSDFIRHVHRTNFIRHVHRTPPRLIPR